MLGFYIYFGDSGMFYLFKGLGPLDLAELNLGSIDQLVTFTTSATTLSADGAEPFNTNEYKFKYDNELEYFNNSDMTTDISLWISSSGSTNVIKNIKLTILTEGETFPDG